MPFLARIVSELAKHKGMFEIITLQKFLILLDTYDSPDWSGLKTHSSHRVRLLRFQFNQ